MPAPNLLFGPGSPTGFTPAGIAGFDDLRSAAVVRELIQNSLDAAMEAREKTAIVRFQLFRDRIETIPGIQNYRAAFEGAVQSHGGKDSLPGPARRVVQVMSNALRKDEHDVLCVLDNGIGLDRKRMAALLSDGVSAKGEGSTGTFGNGHSVAIPASDLRYVLYGGITAGGRRIAAGHAVLASRTIPNEKYPHAGDGFLIRRFLQGGAHEYAQGDSIPGFIASELDDIEKSSVCGTAVIIPAFNSFRETEFSLWDTVSKAAACNFFPAIEAGRLVVWAEDMRPGGSDDLEALDTSTLKGVLEKYRDEKRSRSFLGGFRAFEAHEALKRGERHIVSTREGQIELRLRLGISGSTRIDLCRNGMWIADDKKLPGFYYKFKDRQTFHAVLLLDSTTQGHLHRLVRDAEGPLHDKLDVKSRLSREDARRLRSAFAEIVDYLKSRTPEISTETYSPDDFLALDFGDDTASGRGKARGAFWGQPIPVDRRDSDLSRRSVERENDGSQDGQEGTDGRGSGPRDGRRTRRSRRVLRPFFQAISVPDGPARRCIRIECQETCENAELRMSVDENVDATCDRSRSDETSRVRLEGVRIDGRDARDDELVRENGRVVGVRLGNIEKDASIRVDTGYAISDDYTVMQNHEPALRVEMFRTPPATRKEQ